MLGLLHNHLLCLDRAIAHYLLDDRDTLLGLAQTTTIEVEDLDSTHLSGRCSI